MANIWTRESQEDYEGLLPLDVADELDNLASKRRGEYHEEINFAPIQRFGRKLNAHLEHLKNNLTVDTLPCNYLFNNPLFNATLKQYNLSQDSYFREGIRAIKYLRDIDEKLSDISERFNRVVENPRDVNISEIQETIRFCINLTEEERNAESALVSV